MTDTMAKRLAAFDETISQILNFYGITDQLDTTGLDRDDFNAILREEAWNLIREKGDLTKAFICKALWNRARMLLRLRRARIAKQRVFPTETTETAVFEDRAPNNPWNQIDARLDVQKVVDALSPDEVQILWTVAQEGRTEAGKELGLKKTTLHRRYSSALEESRARLAA